MIKASPEQILKAKLLTKAIKAGKLAISEETIGNDIGARAAAIMCGELANKGDQDLDGLYQILGLDVNYSPLAWNYIVDGWYDNDARN